MKGLDGWRLEGNRRRMKEEYVWWRGKKRLQKRKNKRRLKEREKCGGRVRREGDLKCRPERETEREENVRKRNADLEGGRIRRMREIKEAMLRNGVKKE